MSAINKYDNLSTLARKLRADLAGVDLILLYAYNRTGKTRLSMAFKDEGKRKNKGISDTLYFNAFTEDLFTWDNDLQGDAVRQLQLNPDSTFFDGLKDLALDETIAAYLRRYADFDFDIDYTTWKISFSKEVLRQNPGAEPERITETNIKISRGEQNIFIWCLFMAKALNSEDLVLYNRALNLLSHGKYAIHEPTEMGEDNKEMFRRILNDFITAFQFELPNILEPSLVPPQSATALAT